MVFLPVVCYTVEMKEVHCFHRKEKHHEHYRRKTRIHPKQRQPDAVCRYRRHLAKAIQVCTSVLAFLITLRIYGLHINSAYKISWIILILLFPVFGLTIYLLFRPNKYEGVNEVQFDSKKAVASK